ncbi:MAG: STAS domain-containing protein [Methylacidiphilales bacterium]|nr:STAS domain-containing protein [Candidatus Methylacidiphilales bacterium]
MEIKVIHTGDDYTHLALCGRMDVTGVNEIEAQFLTLTAERKLSAVIDISEVSFTGSSGLRLFLRAVKTLHKEKKVLILLNPQPMLKAVLLDSGIQDTVIIEKNLESAISRAKI